MLSVSVGDHGQVTVPIPGETIGAGWTLAGMKSVWTMRRATEALVEAHPVRLHLHGLGGGIDEQSHIVARHRADLAGEALERVLGLDVVADPISVPGFASRRSARVPSARSPRWAAWRRRRREAVFDVAPGPGWHALLGVPLAPGEWPLRTRRHRARIVGGTGDGRWGARTEAARARSRRPVGGAARRKSTLRFVRLPGRAGTRGWAAPPTIRA